MHKVKVERNVAMLEITLSGMIDDTEVVELVDEIRQGIISLRGRPIQILVDAQFLRPVAPEVTDQMRAVQEYGIEMGVTRVAQVVESSVVLLQRTRVMRESGTDPLTRTFDDLEKARAWVLET